MAKHTTKITIIILLMFLITQFLGLWIVNYYAQPENVLPFGMDTPEIEDHNTAVDIISLVVAFAIAIGLFFLFTLYDYRSPNFQDFKPFLYPTSWTLKHPLDIKTSTPRPPTSRSYKTSILVYSLIF